MPVGVTSTSANRTSPANNPDNQLNHPASHYGPSKPGKETREPHNSSAVSRPCPSRSRMTATGSLPPRTLLPPGSPPPLLPPQPSQPKNKKRPATKTPPPTSPHELDQVTVLDVVAKVADIHAIFPLAVFGEFDRFFVRCIYWPTERAR
jgi:hypothetical protein